VLSSYVSHMLMAYLLSLCLLWVGIYLYFSNQVLIKLDKLKVLNVVNMSAFPC
jgi:hypothetical protein